MTITTNYKETELFTLKDARLKKGLRQSEMAKLMDMTIKTYIQYEKYRVVFRFDDAEKFSKITNIPMSSIIFFEK